MSPQRDSPLFVLTIKILNPSDRLSVAYRSQIALGSRKVGVSEDDLAHDFNWHTGPGCIGCRMPTKVMRSQMDSNQPPGLYHHHPGCLIGNRKNPFLRTLTFFRRIITEFVGHLLRDEHDFVFLAAFWFSKDQLTILYII